MIFEYATLKLIWWFLTTVMIVAFAVTGGMDIGVNILLAMVGKSNEEKRLILNSVGPTWEGNQVWLITFGASLFAIWPILYATAFSSLYIALLIVVVMLILRPPGFDYRNKIDSGTWRKLWDYCIVTSGIVLAIVFGVAIGNLFLGLPFDFDADLRLIYNGNFFHLLSPIPVLFGVVSISMLIVQGGLFLQYKLEANLAKRASNFAKIFGLIFILTFLVAGYCVCYLIPSFKIVLIPDLNGAFSVTHKLVETIPTGWLDNYSNHKNLWLLPSASIIGMIIAVIFSHYSRPKAGLAFSSLAICCTIFTAAAALFPFMLPSNLNPNHSLTIWDSSSSHATLNYTLVVLILLLPIILAYTTWVYSVMRGKVKLQSNSY